MKEGTSSGEERVTRRIRSSLVRRLRRRPANSPYEDLDPDAIRVFEQVRDFTLTGPHRVAALIDSVRYLQKHRVPGAFVECGVWRGGSMMAAALTLMDVEGGPERDLFLYDTFEGMPPPGEHDVDLLGVTAVSHFEADPEGPLLARAPLDDVRKNLSLTGYRSDRIHFVVGRVEDTIPATVPTQIALLRLDTDWYESTKHELRHLFPLLSPGGILIIDDYGHWQGARLATDEWMAETGTRLFFQRIDYTGRLAVKQ